MPTSANNTVHVVASGDLREPANRTCWPKQDELEKAFEAACGRIGLQCKRAHSYDPERQHGFISNQRQGLDVLAKIPDGAKVAVVFAAWQYSHHVLQGLMALVEQRRAQLLLAANWDGTWPGLVGMSNLHASLWKYGVPHAHVWSRDLGSQVFLDRLAEWSKTGTIQYNAGPMTPIPQIS